MAKGKKGANDVKVRDYIKDYGGQKYGITEDDIGWARDPNSASGTSALLGGTNLINPGYIDDQNYTWADQGALQSSIDLYAQNLGLPDLMAGYQAPEETVPEYQAPEYSAPDPYQKPEYKAPAAWQAPDAYKAPEGPAAFQSPYSDKIDSLLNTVLNPGSFSYNPETDPGYQAYEKVYTNLGDRATTNAMGTAAGMTGGRLNSWAMTAGRQAGDVYNEQLAGKVPELMQMAYGMFRDKLGDNSRNLGMLQDLENTSYGRHRDDVGDWRDERDFGYGQYNDDRNFGRGVYESDRGFERGAFESDRDFGRGVYEDERDTGRGTFESDREYNRGVYDADRGYAFDTERADRSDFESDRTYNRGNLESDRAWGANEEQRDIDNEYRDDRADRADTESDRAYNYQIGRDKIMDGRWRTEWTAQEQQQIIENSFKRKQISLQERDQLMAETKESDNDKSTEALNTAYKNMMSSPDPAAWLEKNKATLTPEIYGSLKDFSPEDETLGPIYQGMMQHEGYDDPEAWLIANADWIDAEELKYLAGELPDQSDELERLIAEKLKEK
jgi:hypothetical protein